MLNPTSSLIDQIDLATIMKVASDLISFRTESEKGTDFERATNYLSRIFEKLDFEVKTLGSDKRPTLVGTKKTAQTGTNIFLNGHYDVVPAGDLAAWDNDPFTPVFENGRLYGRGAADMKGGLAVICEVARILNSEDALFQGNLFVTVTPDEEIGSKNGAALLMKSQILPRGKDCYGLMPECSGLDTIWHASKGTLWYEVRIWGKQAHSTLPSEGVNAFEKMCELVNTKLSPLRVIVEKRKSKLDGEFPDSPYAVMNVGGYSHGATSINTIPGSAIFSIDRRLIPEERVSEAREEIENALEGYAIESGTPVEAELLLKAGPCFVDEQTQLCQVLVKSAETFLSRPPRFALCLGHLDIRFFNAYGIPMVAYGPGGLAVAHAPNEFIEVNHLVDLVKIYLLTCLTLTNNNKEE
ncbi:MAG: M20 family metallopeptidase [Candidatus Heimdallarchaeota archaeon]